MFRGERFLCFLGVFFEALSWYVDSFILDSNVHNSRFICFVVSDVVFSLPGAVHKASNTMSLSSPDFKHFNRVLLTIFIVLFTMPFDCTNSVILVSCSKSQFAENFRNSYEVNSGLLPKKTSLGIPCLTNIAFIFFITIGEVLLMNFLLSEYSE